MRGIVGGDGISAAATAYMWKFFSKRQTEESAIARDFTTPEGAVLCLEDAYRRRDLDAAAACKDFRLEARQMLRNLGDGKLADDEAVLSKTAEVLELAYRAEKQTHGFPDMNGVRSAFEPARDAGDGAVIVTEICLYPDGRKSKQQLLVAQTPRGWRVLNPIQ